MEGAESLVQGENHHPDASQRITVPCDVKCILLAVVGES
jgi:hypothetical protein